MDATVTIHPSMVVFFEKIYSKIPIHLSSTGRVLYGNVSVSGTDDTLD